MKLKLLCITVCIGFVNLQAQDLSLQNKVDKITKPNSKNFYRTLDFEYGMNFQLMSDNISSPNPTSGIGLPVFLGYSSYKKNHIFKIQLGYQNVSTSTEGYDISQIITLMPAKGFSVKTNYIEFQAEQLYHLTNIKKNENNGVFLGWQTTVQTLLSTYDKFSNSQLNFGGFWDVGPKASVNYAFKLFKRDFNFNYSLAIPVLAAVYRPQFNYSSVPKANVSFLGQYTKLNSEAMLEYKISNKNKIAFIYRWQYLNSSREFETQRFQMTNDYLILKLSLAL